MTGRTRGPVRLGTITRTHAEGLHRVEADVDGTPVWFESRDTVVHAAPEALASTFLIPALHQNRALESVTPLDAEWRAHVDQLLPILRRWWRYAPRRPLAPAAGAADSQPSANGHTAGSALFFSGGVDSFYSLLCVHAQPDRLVLVHGFDVPLNDDARIAVVDSALRAVATARGLTPVLVRTNLREHPLLRAIPWERSHGGALAGVGHLLGVSELLISSSIVRGRAKPWGSHWEIDHLHSSHRTRIRQVGSELRRSEKIPHIANDPLVQRFLRVCWENRSADANCSVCEKCVITRLALSECGALDGCRALAGSATLVRDLRALPRISHNLNALTRLSASTRLAPEVAREAQALLRRSRHALSWPVVARRAALRTLAGWTGRRRT
jgi:hypothetical protein